MQNFLYFWLPDRRLFAWWRRGNQPAGGGSRSPSQSPTATAPPEGEPLVQVQRRENVLAVLIPLGARRGSLSLLKAKGMPPPPGEVPSLRGGEGLQLTALGSANPSQSPTATAPPEGEPLLRPEGAAKELSIAFYTPPTRPNFSFTRFWRGGDGHSWSRCLFRRAMGLQTPYSGIYI